MFLAADEPRLCDHLTFRFKIIQGYLRVNVCNESSQSNLHQLIFPRLGTGQVRCCLPSVIGRKPEFRTDAAIRPTLIQKYINTELGYHFSNMKKKEKKKLIQSGQKSY